MRKFNLRRLIVWAIASFSISASSVKAETNEISKRVSKFQTEILKPENSNSKIAKYFAQFHKSTLDKTASIERSDNELEASVNVDNWNNWDMWNNWDSWNNWNLYN